ncbi:MULTISPECIES: methylaspartate ammonia-lyase [Morganella]|jgi:methylaspartate ammonia-lyase|uniref:methylaspartate ammonia-lyase n=1 Tax=Morganella morganii TaxID=582 RepID=A0A0H2R0M1_MORMO|nr:MULTISPECIES: methylaspartate ammonia-lyase [Morganella]BEP22587.1 methylaspartate ammonia-lyase [Morganella morganii subsp. sibonii]HAS8351058.1 methylaspartate ammonia-lyase [Vibrio vulnificus]EGT3624338.1 methylaspartate ammonia-lyase [Morganella morganii]EGT3629871.1 methylaspartate ammonia-lyase [Morganella morganii]EGT3633091.1 methylaspartate ammonia-lyase [Morganella morganii]
MKIKQALFTAGNSSFYFDDQQAIKDGAGHDGFVYTGKPVTPGFTAVRQAGECVSVQLILENGSVAMGDCAAVQYSGAGGRDPLFLAENFIPFLEKHIKPLLEGRDVSEFRNNAKFFDELKVEGKQLHTAIRYGLSQALLDATALASNRLKAEVVCDEWHLPVVADPIPLFGQSGDDRYNAVDKMILKHVDVLPHGLINNVDEKLGRQGEKLRAYVEWLAKRIVELRTEDTYKPSLHIDVYGTIGLIFDKDPIRCAEYIASLQEQAGDLELYIEGPVDAGNKPDQIRLMKGIMDHLKKLGSKVKIVADEWCNTCQDIIDFTDAGCCDMVQIKTPDLGSVHNIADAVLYCQKHGMEAYQGGTCNETDVSARTCVHIAIATRPMRMLIKPGMGFDEGMNIVHNEMNRTLAVLKAKA